ncbi:predicted protein [Histoplasma capsulatum H143]|uniref:Uncharacterized protein n=1 Tax=Ajellomyces capsulatus (strain H143) TaxID=544712 RepID=C6H6U3_AJECH|nr:predicted protein [Histoplasma capsulatum H143]
MAFFSNVIIVNHHTFDPSHNPLSALPPPEIRPQTVSVPYSLVRMSMSKCKSTASTTVVGTTIQTRWFRGRFYPLFRPQERKMEKRYYFSEAESSRTLPGGLDEPYHNHGIMEDHTPQDQHRCSVAGTITLLTQFSLRRGGITLLPEKNLQAKIHSRYPLFKPKLEIETNGVRPKSNSLIDFSLHAPHGPPDEDTDETLEDKTCSDPI